MTKFAEVRRAFADAQERFAAYHAECVHFAAAFARALMEDFGWPRDHVRFGQGAEAGERPEEAMRLADDGLWVLPLALHLEEGAAQDVLAVTVRFRRAGDAWQLLLFPTVEFEISAPTREAFAPVLDALHRAIRGHYEQGLSHFLDGRSGRLLIPYAPPRPPVA